MLDSSRHRCLGKLFLDKLFLDKLLTLYLFKHLVALGRRLRNTPAHPSAVVLVALACSRKKMYLHGLATDAWLSLFLITLHA